MKKYLFTFIIFALLASCSVKTNEEKARELIEPQVKASLIKPESYEFAQIKLDSCFSNSQNNPDIIALAMKVAKLWKEYKNYSADAESAESSIAIYAPSYGQQSAYDKQRQKKYKAEMEKAQRKATTTKEKILQLYKDNKRLITDLQSVQREFIGWAVSFGFRAETAGGMKTMGEDLFYLNKELTEVTYHFSEEDMKDMLSVDYDDLNYEFEKELKELYGE
jgi:hypothetical protein